MEDLTVECDSIRVHSKTATVPTIPPIVIAAGLISIFGIILAATTTTSAVPITTGILGGKPVAVKLGTLK
jgi:hypothetical protein